MLNAGSMFVHCSVIGRFILSPGIDTMPCAMLDIHIFLFQFFVCFRKCNGTHDRFNERCRMNYFSRKVQEYKERDGTGTNN